jgi:hypothetical protein
MSLWTKQPIFCNACGMRYETDFQVGYPNGKHVCSRECFEEMRRRDVLSMLGKPFHPVEESR